MLRNAVITLVVCSVSLSGVEPAKGTVERAVALATEGRMDEAETMLRIIWNHALATHQNTVVAQAAGYLGTLHRFRGDAARAIPLLRFAKSHFPPESEDAADISAQLGAALAQEGQLAAAERELRSACRTPSARVHLAVVLTRRNALREAEALLWDVLVTIKGDIPPANSVRALAHLTLARILSQNKDARAAAHYRSAIAAYDRLHLDHPDREQAIKEANMVLRSAKAATLKTHEGQ